MRTAIPIATTRRSSAAIGAAVGAGGGAGTVLIDGQNATSLPRGTAFTIRSGTFETRQRMSRSRVCLHTSSSYTSSYTRE